MRRRSPFGRDTWESLVVPHQGFFVTLLIVAEASAGVLVLAGGRMTQLGLASLMAFHVGQLAFGGVLWVWAPFMLVTLGLLLRAERLASNADLAPDPRPEDALPGATARVADAARLPNVGRTDHVGRHA